MDERYLARKLRDIEREIAVAVGGANLVGVMFGKCTDGVIEGRDQATKNVIKIVHQLLKRQEKDGAPH